MGSDVIEFQYRFTEGGQSGEGTEVTFNIRLDPETLDQIRPVRDDLPEWTRLEHQQCAICPLRGTEASCPAAISILDMVERCVNLLSYAQVEAALVASGRTISVSTTAQRALSSVIGLSMATSGCPVLAKFKPMARFHLPFASTQETLFRAAGSYLIAQYFVRRRGGDADLDLEGLRKVYGEIHEVNKGLTNRIRTKSEGDASVNALAILDLFAHNLPVSIEENLTELEPLFQAFFEE